ncbi:acyl-CoA dehydrogenase family protein [Psychrobacter fozii]|uniref:Medium-chain specific acyl-CoA dehydrogenase, mitochondrial n=1 Tax=Psychrobacter fozii TaxID=198480 RepID=A0A2V4V7K8_9GAMM|nr:acyl-CoA dehydrogenase family protein [Psychrobacter fozii]PYE38448.1 alkylation response protein AidB-like acyl-CoA dehydrogenase [Psychrobacter fozii]
MDFNLSKEHLELQAKAKEFTETVLFPHEMECEENDGISRETHQKIIDATLAWGFNAPNHSKEDGGQGFSIFEQTILNEQLGKATGAIWDALWYPSYPMRFATQAQKEEYLIPTCQGKRRDAYAITEADAGSDPTQCMTRADKVEGGWKINGEKWFVTIGDIADYILVHAHVDGDSTKPTVFFVEKNLPGVELKRTPLYTHHFAFKHPEYIFNDVIVGEDKVLGEIGQGYDMTKDWFVEARLGIAARCVGGAIRAAEEANKFAAERIQFGQPINNFQAIEFMLADMGVEIMAAKSMLYRLSWEIDQTGDRKLNHAKAAALKLYCSEMVGRVCDKAVQILGGRGYMREQAVERLWRDTRVDRIWEGTSEIQRVIISGQIKKRGLDIYTGW